MPLVKQTILAIFLILFCLPHVLLAASHEHHENNAKSDAEHAHHMESQFSQGGQLSPELLALLNQEMGLIQQGMMDMLPAISAGEWDKVSAIGLKIKESFILKQELTEAQKEELHRVLDTAIHRDGYGLPQICRNAGPCSRDEKCRCG